MCVCVCVCVPEAVVRCSLMLLFILLRLGFSLNLELEWSLEILINLLISAQCQGIGPCGHAQHLVVVVVFCLFVYRDKVFLCSFGACLGTHSRPRLALNSEIRLPLPPEC